MEKFKITLQDITEYDITVKASDTEEAETKALHTYHLTPDEDLHETCNFVKVKDIEDIARYEARVERNITYIVPIYSNTIEEASKKVRELESSSNLEEYEISKGTYIVLNEKH